MTIDRNLEIIVDSDCKLLAYRYDLPVDMQWMVINAGQWKVYNVDNIIPEFIVEVKILMGRLKRKIFLNYGKLCSITIKNN